MFSIRFLCPGMFHSFVIGGVVKGIENMHGGKYIGPVIDGRVGMIFMFMLLVAFSYNIRTDG